MTWTGAVLYRLTSSPTKPRKSRGRVKDICSIACFGVMGYQGTNRLYPTLAYSFAQQALASYYRCMNNTSSSNYPLPNQSTAIVVEIKLPAVSRRQISAVPLILLPDNADHLNRTTRTTDGLPRSRRSLSLTKCGKDSAQPDFDNDSRIIQIRPGFRAAKPKTIAAQGWLPSYWKTIADQLRSSAAVNSTFFSNGGFAARPTSRSNSRVRGGPVARSGGALTSDMAGVTP